MRKNISIYVPVSEKSKDFGFIVTKISLKEYLIDSIGIEGYDNLDSSVSSNRWYTPIKEDYFQLFYIHKGKAFIKSYDFQGYLKAGYFIIFPPNEKFSIEPDLDYDYTQYHVSFSGFIPLKWRENKIMLDNSIPIKTEMNKMEEDFTKLISIVSREKVNYQILLASQVIYNLTKYFQQSFAFLDNEKDNKNPLERIESYFDDNLYEQFNIEDMCDSMEMNYYQLRNYFHEETGLSPYQYLIDMKIKKAIELLETTNYSIKEISYKLAFDSQYYFSRLFKKKTGTSPSKWKKRNL
jgi:AraC-like DNA-binding protein